jgi:surface antigen
MIGLFVSRLLALFAVCVALTGCISTGGPIADAPTGPVTKPAPLSQTAPTPEELLEPLKGGLVSGAIGTGLSAAERQQGLVAEYQALENAFGRTPVTWVGAKPGHGGTVIAGTPYRVGQQDCRPYTHDVQANGANATGRGAACRQANGSWLRLE